MIIGCLAARFARVPKVFAIIEGLGYAFTSGPERKRRMVRAVLGPAMKAALSVCDGVFVINSDDRAYLIGLGILSPRQTVVQIAGTGLDLDHYAYVPPTPGPPRFLLIGRMVSDKGIFEFVAAARIVKAKRPEARFRLVGSIDNHPTAISRTEIAGWEREGVVEYLGVTNDVRPHLADCSVYVLPSYREGMPRTIMEAMAIGRPVIATDVPGCRDAVEDGVTGFLVQPRNVGELAKAMVRVIEDRSIETTLAHQARRRAESHFSAAAVNGAISVALSLQDLERSITFENT
jgi:glycosyltransferase involved in cell wall biosynthesis